jgi:4-azaleucine resistance transporter AzlC
MIGRPRKAYVRQGIVLGAGVGLVGISFGVVAVGGGLSPAKACALSLLVFTGASQFTAVAIVSSGGSPLAAVAGALMVGARNAAYGFAMAPLLRGGTLQRALKAQLVLDESTAFASAQAEPRDAEGAFLTVGLSVFMFWNLGTLIGALAGTSIGAPETFGLDMAITSAFVSLVVPHLRRSAPRAAAAAGAAVALALVPTAPAGLPVLGAAAGALAGAWVQRRPRGEDGR